MKKSLIALAVASAIPVAAQADLTLSGSVTATYNNQYATKVTKSGDDVTGVVALKETLYVPATSAAALVYEQGTMISELKGKDEIGVSASLSLSASEVLANGMTASAGFTVADGSSASASLSGAFGTLAVGDAGEEATMDKGDVGGAHSATDDSDIAITYDGTVGDMNVGFAQQTGSDGNTQAYATMNFQGVNVGVGTYDPRGSKPAVSVLGASYTIDGLTLTAGKKSGKKSVTAASYAGDFGDFAVSATASSDDTSNLSATYNMGNISITAATDRTADDTDCTGCTMVPGETSNTVSATYTAGDMTISASSDDTLSVALDMGNADLTLERVAAASATAIDKTVGNDDGPIDSITDEDYKVAVPAHTKLTYKVSF